MVRLRSRQGHGVGSQDATAPRILFVHIPKTAGMSLYQALERWATQRRSIRFPNGGTEDLRTWLELPDARISELRLISGHLPLHDFRRRGLGGWSPITLLRDPVARTLSTFSYIRGERRHPWHRLIAPMDLEAFLDWFEGRPANHDQQCAFINSQRTAAAAFATLQDDFLLAATVEQLPRFDADLSTVLGTDIRTRHSNRSRATIDPSSVDARLLDRIRGIQQEDDRLYRLVLEAGPIGTASTH